MGPNLTRLFQIANRGSGFSLETQLSSEKMLRKLFDRHGEALIEALERLLEDNEDYIRINNLSAMGNVNLVNARQLLAQLEAEAQP